MPLPTDIANEFDDVDTTTDDDSNDTNTDVEDTSTDNDTEDSNDNDNDTDDDSDDKTDADDSGDDKDDKVDDEDDDDSAYFTEDTEDDTDTDNAPPVPTNFTPEEKYIADNLPILTVRLILADDSIKTIQARSVNDFPADAKGYATFAEGERFRRDAGLMENEALKLQTYYRQHQAEITQREYERKETLTDRDDILDLRRAGKLPPLKGNPGTKEFDDSPAGKIINEVLEFKNERNAKYLAAANAGKAFNHISFADAFELMNIDKPVTEKNSPLRRNAANRLRSGQGGTPKNSAKVQTSGKQLRDVAAEFDDYNP